MARLQATVDEKTLYILDKLFRRNDRARFIELAIKYAENNPEIREQFSWKNKNELDNNLKKIKMDEENFKKQITKVVFDDEF